MGEPWLGYWVRASKNYDCFIRSGINPDIKHQSFVDCHQLFSVTLSRISIQPGNKNVCPTCYIHINFSNSPTSLNMSFLKRAITLALLQNKTGFSENRIYHSSLSLLLWRMVRKKTKRKDEVLSKNQIWQSKNESGPVISNSRIDHPSLNPLYSPEYFVAYG